MLMAPTSNDVLGGGVGALGTGLREASFSLIFLLDFCFCFKGS